MTDAEGRELDALLKADRRRWHDGEYMSEADLARLDELVDKLRAQHGHLLGVFIDHEALGQNQ